MRYLSLLLLACLGCSSANFEKAPSGQGVAGPGGGNVGNCYGFNGSPSCNIIQVPQTASASTATVSCPTDYKLIGCGFLCDGGSQPGGTEMLSDTSCRAHCKNSSTSKATAFCYRGDQTRVTRVQVTNVPRDTDVYCPSSHPQVLGCTTRCVNADQSNNPGGATLSPGGTGCRARCDWNNDSNGNVDRSPQLTVYCGNFPGAYSQISKNSIPNNSNVNCPAGTTMAGGIGMCNVGRTGGFIASDSRTYIGKCISGENLENMDAFCLAD